MSENKKPCPQFPYWGASYPDACCVDGILQDLDYCDENGNLYDKGGDVPMPDECTLNGEKVLACASEWLSDNVNESDAMDWKFDIEDFEDE